jgi:MFS family permease
MRTELGFRSDLAIGFVVFLLFACSALGQALQGRLATPWRLPAGCAGLIAGLVLIALAVATRSSAALIGGALCAGAGQGASFRAGLGDITARSPADTRAGVTSTYFVVLYVAISLPIVGLGVAVQMIDMRHAALLFSACTALLVVVAMALLLRNRHSTEPDAGAIGK